MPATAAQHLTGARLEHVTEKWNEAEYWLVLDRPVPASLAVRDARTLGNLATLQPGLVDRVQAALRAERERVWNVLPRGSHHASLPPSRIAHKARITTSDVYPHLEHLSGTGHAAVHGNGSRRRYTWLPGEAVA